MLVELSYKEFQAKLHPRKDPEEGEATAHRVKGWKKPNQPQDRNRKRNRGYRKPIGASINEVAPPSAKHERMVKHIKKSYKKDGKLTKKEKSIAYATAWKDYRKESADIDWKIKNTLSSHKTDHKTGNFSVGKRWMSDQERVGKMNNMMTGVKMDADGLLPDVGGAVQKNVDKGIPIAAKFIDKGNAIANKALSDKLGQEVNIKNMDGETFKNMATNANKDTAFNINRNIPGTQAYRFQGVSDMINKNKSLKASYEPEAELVELNRYGKETGKATGSINKRPGSKVKKGGNTSDKALLAVRGMIRRETGKPEGQRKKTKGEKGRRQVGDRKFSPADTIAKRRQSKKDADAAMMDTRGT